ncbi:MAG: hypothetical protein ACOYBE_08880 [Blautia sp.]|jgi:hypothetical protein
MRKKSRTIILCGLVAACLLSGCTGTEKKQEVTNEKGEAVNSLEEVKDSKVFADLGAEIEVPMGAENAKYYVVDKKIAEIQFVFYDADYVYRGSRSSGDISGKKEEFQDAKERTVAVKNTKPETEVTVKTNGDGARLGIWTLEDGSSYSLYTEGDMEDAAFDSLCKELVKELN